MGDDILNFWHLLKANILVNTKTGLVHSLSGASANVYDITRAASLLYGRRQMFFPIPATLAFRGDCPPRLTCFAPRGLASTVATSN